MADLTLYVTFEPEAETAGEAKLRAALETDLRRIQTIANVSVPAPTGRFTGLELLAGVTLAAAAVHQAASVVHDLKAMIEDVRAMMGPARVKTVKVPVGIAPKSIDTLTEEDYQTIAEDIVEARDSAADA